MEKSKILGKFKKNRKKQKNMELPTCSENYAYKTYVSITP